MNVVLLPEEQKLLNEAHESVYSYLEIGYLNQDMVKDSTVHRCVYAVHAARADVQTTHLANIIAMRMFMEYTSSGRNRPKLTPERERIMRLAVAKSRYLLNDAMRLVEHNIFVTSEIIPLIARSQGAQAALSEFRSGIHGRGSNYTSEPLPYIVMRTMYRSYETSCPFIGFGPDMSKVFSTWESVYHRNGDTTPKVRMTRSTSSTTVPQPGLNVVYDGPAGPRLNFEIPEMPKIQIKGVPCENCGTNIPPGRGVLCLRCKALEAARRADVAEEEV
jgi:hypothetical protein